MRLCVIAVLAVASFAADPEFWDTKPAAEWTTAEIEMLLTDSPWAREATVAPLGLPVPPESRGRSRGGGSRPASSGNMPGVRVLVRWESALPVRLALARKSGRKSGVESEPATYTIAVIGFPIASAGPEDADRLIEFKAGTALTHHGKPLTPDTVERAADGATLIFRFNTRPLTLDDREVDFSTGFGSMHLKRKFRLAEMKYRGKLEL